MRAQAAPATKALGLAANQRNQNEGGSAAAAQLANANSSRATRTHIQISQYGEGNIRLARHSAVHPKRATITARWINSHLKPSAPDSSSSDRSALRKVSQLNPIAPATPMMKALGTPFSMASTTQVQWWVCQKISVAPRGKITVCSTKNRRSTAPQYSQR